MMSKGTLHCPHTTEEDLDNGLVWIFMSLEKDLGQDIIVNNGARCPECNKRVGGVDKSAHLVVPGRKCKAFDINQRDNPQIITLYQYLTGAKNSPERFALLKSALKNDPGMHLMISKLIEKGVNRFGVSRVFFHFDIGLEKDGYPQNVVWLYS